MGRVTPSLTGQELLVLKLKEWVLHQMQAQQREAVTRVTAALGRGLKELIINLSRPQGRIQLSPLIFFF